VSPEVIEALEALPGAVVTRVEAGEGTVRIIAVSDLSTFAIVMEGCDWADTRCEGCSCDPDRVRVRVERV
jgi:hypothetical protein